MLMDRDKFSKVFWGFVSQKYNRTRNVTFETIEGLNTTINFNDPYDLFYKRQIEETRSKK